MLNPRLPPPLGRSDKATVYYWWRMEAADGLTPGRGGGEGVTLEPHQIVVEGEPTRKKVEELSRSVASREKVASGRVLYKKVIGTVAIVVVV